MAEHKITIIQNQGDSETTENFDDKATCLARFKALVNNTSNNRPFEMTIYHMNGSSWTEGAEE